MIAVWFVILMIFSFVGALVGVALVINLPEPEERLLSLLFVGFCILNLIWGTYIGDILQSLHLL